MSDRAIAGQAASLTEKTMQVADDIIQALLELLQDKSSESQRGVLEILKDHIQTGGELCITQMPAGFEKELLKAAVDAKITYFSFKDEKAGNVKILVKDEDAGRMKDLLVTLNEKHGIYKDPQISLQEFYEDRDNDKTEMTYTTKDINLIKKIKYDAYLYDFNFAVLEKENGTFQIIYKTEDQKKADDMHLNNIFGNPGHLFNRMTLQELKEIEKERKRKEQEKERGKNHGRDEANAGHDIG